MTDVMIRRSRTGNGLRVRGPGLSIWRERLRREEAEESFLS
jgi:hypothetical protein